MNMKTMDRKIGSSVAIFLTALSLQAAEQMQLFPSKAGGNQKIRIEGTSTVHDWRMESHLIGGSLEAGPNFPTEPGQAVKPGPVSAKVKVFIPVTSLRSLEKDGTPYSDPMNKVVYEHLKSDEYRMISYSLDELTLKETPKTKDGAYVFDAKGKLGVAGVTNQISMPVSVTPLGNKTLRITGDTKVKMTDFKIDPPHPTGFGLLIKTGDEVKLLFDWTVAQKPGVAPAAANK
jgi:polyisoprenoid-binding protein YceI